jgi:hypothetical protein
VRFASAPARGVHAASAHDRQPAQMFSNASQLSTVKRNKFRAPGRAAAEDELGNKIRRAPGGFTQRHAESEKIFRVHINQIFVNSSSTTRL